MADTNQEVAAGSETNVFGKPITEDVLLGIPEYANKARLDRAAVAKEWKNKNGSYDDALSYVRKLKEEWGTGVSTLCLVYNSTGEPLTFVLAYDFLGHIHRTYPLEIANGQWGAFLHVKTAGSAFGSKAAVVYRGKNRDGEDTDWLVGWVNPLDRYIKYDNQASADIKRAGYFDNIDWDTISKAMDKAGRQYRAEWKGCVAEVKTESDASPVYEAVLSLE